MSTDKDPLPTQPLGHRNYGSIPHLSGSRLGPSDRCANPGQEGILTSDSRGRRIILSEKLDGSNMGVARIGDEIIPLNRSGFACRTSPYEFQRHFHTWVIARQDQFLALLDDGERVVGEWLLLAHGTRYHISEESDLFVAFDIMRDMKRTPFDDVQRRCRSHGVKTATVLSDGPPVDIARALEMLGDEGSHGAVDRPEGVVWRAEKKNQCNFLAKYVYPEKVDGCFLPQISKSDPVWNFPPERLLG